MSAENAKFMDKGWHFGILSISGSIHSPVVVRIVSVNHIWGGFDGMHVNMDPSIKCNLWTHRLLLDDSLAFHELLF